MSLERHGMTDHWKRDCLFNSLLLSTWSKWWKVRITFVTGITGDRWKGNPAVDWHHNCPLMPKAMLICNCVTKELHRNNNKLYITTAILCLFIAIRAPSVSTAIHPMRMLLSLKKYYEMSLFFYWNTVWPRGPNAKWVHIKRHSFVPYTQACICIMSLIWQMHMCPVSWHTGSIIYSSIYPEYHTTHDTTNLKWIKVMDNDDNVVSVLGIGMVWVWLIITGLWVFPFYFDSIVPICMYRVVIGC